MFAIELSTSSDCARETRGTASIASTVVGRRASASTRSAFAAGPIRETSVAPSRNAAVSSADGAFTFSTTSASQVSSRPAIRAPVPAYASSVKPDRLPAPDSTITS